MFGSSSPRFEHKRCAKARELFQRRVVVHDAPAQGTNPTKDTPYMQLKPFLLDVWLDIRLQNSGSRENGRRNPRSTRDSIAGTIGGSIDSERSRAMCMDRGSFTAMSIQQLPELWPVDRLEVGGLSFRLRHVFRTTTGAPGYFFDLYEGAHNVGTATVVITRDRALVNRCGHIGCDIQPQFRMQGYTERLANALLPLLKAHGIEEALITSEVGHQSLYDSIQRFGGVWLDQLPADAQDTAKARFRVVL
jgi:acetyltransferase (GNAT) family protein